MSLAYNFKYSRMLEKGTMISHLPLPRIFLHLSHSQYKYQATAFVSSIHMHLLLSVFILNSSSRLTYPEVIRPVENVENVASPIKEPALLTK